MPRKIGYGKFTPARRAALKKAQLESARKRRKFKSEDRSNRKRNLKRAAQLAVGAAAVGAVGYAAYKNYDAYNKEMDRIKKANADRKEEQNVEDPAMASFLAEVEKSRKRLEERKKVYAENIKKCGVVTRPPQTQEEYDARVALYGADNIIGEFSQVHNRPEIFPGIPKSEVLRVMNQEAVRPSYNPFAENPDEDFIVLYHRTGGGSDVDPEEAKQSILRDQQMKILNRDERRAAGENSEAARNNLVWLSNRLNDSNTRDAFGETVVQIRFPKSLGRRLDTQFQTFGDMSPNEEAWICTPPEIINEAIAMGYKFEEVPSEMITPKPERKWKAK